MKVSSICNRDLAVAHQDDSLYEAAKLMRQRHVGSLIIVSEDVNVSRPIGIVTDRDIVAKVIAEEFDLNNVTLKDIMSTQPLIAREDDEVTDTFRGMCEKGVRRVPVVDTRGYLVGVFSIDDLMTVISSKLSNLSLLIENEGNAEVISRSHN